MKEFTEIALAMTKNGSEAMSTIAVKRERSEAFLFIVDAMHSMITVRPRILKFRRAEGA